MRRFVITVAVVCCSPVFGLSKGSECRGYIACAEHTIAPKGSLDAQYGTNGRCWVGGPERSEICEDECREGIYLLKLSYPDAGCEGTLPRRLQGGCGG